MTGDLPKVMSDRRSRSLMWLGFATLAAIVIAIVVIAFEDSSVSPAFKPEPLFPQLSAQVEQNLVRRIAVKTADVSFEVTQTEDGRWVLPGKGGYAARFEFVKRAVNGMAKLMLVERKTARPDWHAEMDLVAPEEKGKAREITLYDASGNVLAALLMGKIQEAPSIAQDGTVYVRRMGEDQAWLARGFLTLNPAEAEWLDKSLFEISRERVREAVISPEGSDAYTLTRADPAALDFTLADLPKGREALSSSALNGVGSALEGLAFEDVVAQGSIDFSKASRAAFTTFEGLTVVITIAGQDGEAWATFTAIADPSLAVPEKTEAPAPAEEGTAPEEGVPPASEETVPPSDEAVPAEPVPAGPDIAEEAKRINALTAGWAYKLPRYKAQLLTTTRDLLLKPEGEEE